MMTDERSRGMKAITSQGWLIRLAPAGTRVNLGPIFVVAEISIREIHQMAYEY